MFCLLYLILFTLFDGEGAGLPIQRSHVQNHWVAPRSTQPFIFLRSIKWVPGISGNLVVKSKLPPRSGSSLEAVEPHPWKGAIKFCFFIQFVFFTKTGFVKNSTRVVKYRSWVVKSKQLNCILIFPEISQSFCCFQVLLTLVQMRKCLFFLDYWKEFWHEKDELFSIRIFNNIKQSLY